METHGHVTQYTVCTLRERMSPFERVHPTIFSQNIERFFDFLL
jgi:hypothetical protein